MTEESSNSTAGGRRKDPTPDSGEQTWKGAPTSSIWGPKKEGIVHGWVTSGPGDRSSKATISPG